MSWPRVRAEFESLVDLPAAARQARLRELEGTDGWLAGQLRALLDEDGKAASFLERTPDSAAAPVPAVGFSGLRVGRIPQSQ